MLVLVFFSYSLRSGSLLARIGDDGLTVSFSVQVASDDSAWSVGCGARLLTYCCPVFAVSVSALFAIVLCSEGGLFKARLSFPADYPFMPPTMKFETAMWHPNVYKDGRVCISILHPPGNDPAQYELASERWSPVHTVETILLSVISMLASPNDESAANLDAAKEWRDTPDVFKRKVRDAVRRAQEDWG